MQTAVKTRDSPKGTRSVFQQRQRYQEFRLKNIPKPFVNLKIQTFKTKKSFKTPISASKALAQYMQIINEADLKDINDFNEIYYLSKTKAGTIIFQSDVAYYTCVKSAHIGYRYESLKLLGRGSFGTVLKCFDHKMQRNVAIKLLYNNSKEKHQIGYEVSFLKTLSNHNNGAENHYVVNLIDHFTFRGFTCIVTDLYDKDLYSYIEAKRFKGLEMAEVRSIGRQIADAMAFAHSADIVHADLKPENVLFSDASKTNVAIIDFGCGCYHRQPMYKIVQSLYYRSPEVIFNFKYGTEIDVWSFGCIIFELVTGHPLFQARNEQQLIEQITALIGEPPLEMIERSKKMRKYFAAVPADRTACEARKKRIITQLMPTADSELIDVVIDCLGWLPAKRPTMERILEYPFFRM
jgi:dual specificity tyrosine-phosphorylation-regulated kinase 2/3/4